MLWFLVLHIIALLFWTASLLYLPALILGAVTGGNSIEEPPDPLGSVSRYVFTRVATPAALVAIAAGTLVFVINRTIDAWLVAKLTLVAGLVGVHALTGWLILRAEEHRDRPLKRWCVLLTVVAATLMLAIIWLVLSKPAGGVSG